MFDNINTMEKELSCNSDQIAIYDLDQPLFNSSESILYDMNAACIKTGVIPFTSEEMDQVCKNIIDSTKVHEIFVKCLELRKSKREIFQQKQIIDQLFKEYLSTAVKLNQNIQISSNSIDNSLLQISKFIVRGLVIYRSKQNLHSNNHSRMKQLLKYFQSIIYKQDCQQSLSLKEILKFFEQFYLSPEKHFYIVFDLRDGNKMKDDNSRIIILSYADEKQCYLKVSFQQKNIIMKQNKQKLSYCRGLTLIKDYQIEFPFPMINIKQKNKQKINQSRITLRLIKDVQISLERFNRSINQSYPKSQQLRLLINKLLLKIKNLYDDSLTNPIHSKQNIQSHQQVNQMSHIGSQTESFISNSIPKSPQQIFDLINHIKYHNQSLSWRQIQSIVIEEIKSIKTQENLIDKINHQISNLDRMGKIKNLGDKNIHIIEDNKISIHFKYQINFRYFLYNSKKLQQSNLLIPLIIDIDTNNRIIKQQYIHSQQHIINQSNIKDFINIAHQISKMQGNFPKLQIQSYKKQLKQNLQYWNLVSQQNRIQIGEEQHLLLYLNKIITEMSHLKTRTVFRDINLTNLLRAQNNSIYLIDIQNINIDPYLIDICFLINDKKYYFDDNLVQIALIQFFRLQNLQKKQQQNKIHSNIQIFPSFTLRWLLLLTKHYFVSKKSFQMDFRVLMIQVYRSFSRIKNQLQFQSLQDKEKYIGIIYKIMKGMVKVHQRLEYCQNLIPLPKSIIFILGTQSIEKTRIKNQICDELKQRSVRVVNVDELKNCNENEYNQLIDQTDRQTGQNHPQQNTVSHLLSLINQSNAEIILLDSAQIKIWYQINNLYEEKVINIVLQQFAQSANINLYNLKQGKDLYQPYLLLPKYTQKMLPSIMQHVHFQINRQEYTIILLQAGHGSRLGFKQKSTIKIGNQTLFQRWIKLIRNYRVSNIIVADLSNRVNTIKQIIQDKFSSMKDVFKFVCFEEPPGAGITIFQSSLHLKTEKFIVISCDNYSNFPISELHIRNQEQIQGKVLVKSSKKGKYILNQRNLLKGLGNKNQTVQQDTVCFGGIGCFETKPFVQLLSPLRKRCSQFHQYLSQFMERQKMVGVKAKPEHFVININEEKDIEVAQSIHDKVHTLN